MPIRASRFGNKSFFQPLLVKRASQKPKPVTHQNFFSRQRKAEDLNPEHIKLGLFEALLASLNWENLLSGDARTWNELDLNAGKGEPLGQEQHQTILEIANKALENGERDPEQVLQAAKRVGQRAHLVENLRAVGLRGNSTHSPSFLDRPIPF